METLEAIRTRRSIRSFTARNIGDDLVKKLLEAGMYAPSANNRQPWHFIVIRDEEMRQSIPDIHRYAQMAPDAPLGILVCGDIQIEPEPGYLAVNCAAATQNMLLAAHDLGLGAVWIGVYPRKKRIEAFRDLFDLPPAILPIAYLAIGYPDEQKETPERYMADRVRENRW